MSYIVAIDGPAGSGKGTITTLVGEKLGLINIDTGSTYRCVALECIYKNIELKEEKKIEGLLKDIQIEFKKENKKELVFLNGKDVTKEIREKRVNNIVSQVSHIPGVRKSMIEFQRKIAKDKNVIMEGRDIGTKVFPNADIKIYLDAKIEERANRRLKQEQAKGVKITFKEAFDNIEFRDNNDKTSNVGTFKQAKDAIYIDSTNMTIEEVVNKIIEIIKTNKKA